MSASTGTSAGLRRTDVRGRGAERPAEITPAESRTAPHARAAVPGGRQLLGARIALLAAGLALALFPVLRPWGDKTGLDSQAVIAWADPRWIVAHLLGLAGLSLVAAGLVLLARGERRWDPAAVFAAMGALLVAPYFGAETFALPELVRGLAGSPETVVAVATALRGGPVIGALFLAGLLALAVAGVLAWRQGRGAGWAAGIGWTVAALGLAAYLPQFFAPDVLRIVHGIVLGLGLALAGFGLRRDAAGRRGDADADRGEGPCETGSR